MKIQNIIKLAVALAVVLTVVLFVVNRQADHAGHVEGDDHSECDGHDEHSEEEEVDAHDDHSEGEEVDAHDDHGEEVVIELSDAQIKQIGIKVEVAKKGKVQVSVSLPGEVTVNSDRMAHIVPRVSGFVLEVKKKLGDNVKAGEVMAIIQSRELADAKGAYLAAIERLDLAKSIFEREEKLREKKISSEQEYLDAKKVYAEGRIEMRSAEQKLRALGFSEEYLAGLTSESEKVLTRFEITAPFDGIIIEKHITLGEVVSNQTGVFIVADLSTVWVDIQVYQKYLTQVKKGQGVSIAATDGSQRIESIISYVGSFVGSKSRTALARVVLNNKDGRFPPGIFITAKVAVDSSSAGVVISKEAIQTIEGKKCVFVKDEHGFEVRFVTTGKSDAKNVAIASGLKAGENYVSSGAFDLKAKVVTSTLDSHAGHGH
jgi:cobalt-zinc-cadmium efflux system membrane fusion protein